jgi:hypothetical protein
MITPEAMQDPNFPVLKMHFNIPGNPADNAVTGLLGSRDYQFKAMSALIRSTSPPLPD